MALKWTISNLVEVPGPLRDEYKQGDDGRFHLQTDGEHPKVAEFRNKNIELLKAADTLKAQSEADKARLAELATRPDSTKLEADLAAERKAHANTRLKHVVVAEFLYAGGRQSAIDFIADKAAKVFDMEDDRVVTKEFSATDPAQPLSVKEWITTQSKVADFCFQPSSGGGARGNTIAATRFGAQSSAKVLRNPTAQELGQHASDIAAGKVRVEHTE